MVYLPVPVDRARSDDEDSLVESSKSVTRSNSRRERVRGLGIKGAASPSPSISSSETLKPPKKRVSTRRSLVSIITKSVESQIAKHGTSRASHSRSTQSLSPQAPTISPTLWRTSHPSTQSLVSVSSVEDLSTYQANLARFKTERAERVAELGLEIPELSHTDVPRVEITPTNDEQSGRTSGLSLNRGLRAYWGGGSPSGSTVAQNTGKASKDLDLTFDEKADREALKEWWDRLGTEPTGTRTALTA